MRACVCAVADPLSTFLVLTVTATECVRFTGRTTKQGAESRYIETRTYACVAATLLGSLVEGVTSVFGKSSKIEFYLKSTVSLNAAS